MQIAGEKLKLVLCATFNSSFSDPSFADDIQLMSFSACDFSHNIAILKTPFPMLQLDVK